MNKLSFDIKNSQDFLKKLCDDFTEFQQNDTSSRIALNCAMTAWHLTEWVYNEFMNKKFSSVTDFQIDLKNKCFSLQLMHDISNGAKHYKLTKHKPSIKDTELHHGSFSNDFSRDFDISSLKIETNDGKVYYFEDEIENVINFWTSYFESELKLNN